MIARLRSHKTTWGLLVLLDLATRAAYLRPRLGTARGIANYVLASAALWLVVRLVATLRPRFRVPIFAVVIGVPMAVEWAMFRSYGQFVEPTDFLELGHSPRVVFQAASGGADHLGALVVFLLALSTALLLPRASPLGKMRASVATALLAISLAASATYWRASPSLEHPQPAFCSALVGVLGKMTTRSRGAHAIPVPPITTPPSGPLPNIVLLLGESLAASHVSLYGYDRPTTPRLQGLADQLVVFRDAVVMGPHTRTSVPYIMTGLAGPDPSGRVFGAPTVIEYAKARGYHTAFVSAQEESWGALDSILRKGADSFRTGIEFAPDVGVLKGCDDLVLLERGVEPAIASLTPPFFLVVHMDGNHVPYSDHSPAKYKVFPEDGANSIGAYDNTIRVTDEFVARVFAAVRKKDDHAWMFFTSDHGQALGEGGAFYHRGYQTNVVRDPLLVFPPPESRALVEALANVPVSACDLTPTILHLMEAKPVAPVDCVDLFSGNQEPRTRVVSAYTPAFLAEPTMLLIRPDQSHELFDLDRKTVTLDDGTLHPLSDITLPPEVAARLQD